MKNLRNLYLSSLEFNCYPKHNKTWYAKFSKTIFALFYRRRFFFFSSSGPFLTPSVNWSVRRSTDLAPIPSRYFFSRSKRKERDCLSRDVQGKNSCFRTLWGIRFSFSNKCICLMLWRNILELCCVLFEG